MKHVIALTGAHEAAMTAAAKRLLQHANVRHLQLSVLVGIRTAHDAQAIYSNGGELWRVGQDDGHPELDFLLDRWIDDAPEVFIDRLDAALEEFLGKTRIAA